MSCHFDKHIQASTNECPRVYCIQAVWCPKLYICCNGEKKGFSRTRKGNVIVFDMNFPSLISVC